MKRLLRATLQGAVLLTLTTLSLHAQNGGAGNGNASNGHGKPTIDARPVEIPSDDSQTSPAAGQPAQPSTPARPDKPDPAAPVLDAIKAFQTECASYVKNTQALARLQNSDTAEDRAAIREQMKGALDRLREQQRALRAQIKERAADIKAELHPDLARLVDSSQIEGRGR